MMNGKLRDVYAVVNGAEQDHLDIYGVFPTERQAEGYLQERVTNKGSRVARYQGFQLDESPRVLLLNYVDRNPYELTVDYEPDADRIRREFMKSAWAKLTESERNAIGWTREP